jgi:hypothetical protein
VVIAGLVALGLAACAPVKTPPAPPPGLFIEYYLSGAAVMSEEARFMRSPEPHARSVADGVTAAQALLPDGSVALAASGPPVLVELAFSTVPLRLGDISTIAVQRASGSTADLGVLLFFDVDGDGDFLDWDEDGFQVGNGDDIFGEGPFTENGTVVNVGGTTSFDLAGGVAPSRTLDELKAGDEDGIGPETKVAIVVFVSARGGESSVVTSLLVNGVELLVP